jgi:hypothetical protein
MKDFVSSGKSLAPGTACSLYVAVTRARASVALVAECPEQLGLPVWTPYSRPVDGVVLSVPGRDQITAVANVSHTRWELAPARRLA